MKHWYGRGSLWSCLAFLTILVVGLRDASAGAWVHEPNHALVILSSGYYQTDSIYNFEGTERSNFIRADPNQPFSPPIDSTYAQYDANLYVEYGLPWDFEFILNFPFYMAAQQQASIATYTAQGISDMVTGLKYKWFDRPWLLSAFEVDVGIPLGDENATGTATGQVPQPMPLGDGEWDVAFRLIGSRSFERVPVYVSADIGYRIRNIQYGSDDLPWSVEGGYTFSFDHKWFSSLTPFLNFSGVMSFGTLSATQALAVGTALVASGRAPDQEYIDIRPGVSMKIYGPVGFGADYNQTLIGKNTGAGWSVRGSFTLEI